VGINRAVLAIRPLREAIGSEWQAKTPGSGAVYLASVDIRNFTVKLSDGKELLAQEFLKTYKAAIPRDKVPTWYARLLEDKLV
jgi:hypothetical protein